MVMPRSDAVEELHVMSQHALQSEAGVLMVLTRFQSVPSVESPVWET